MHAWISLIKPGVAKVRIAQSGCARVLAGIQTGAQGAKGLGVWLPWKGPGWAHTNCLNILLISSQYKLQLFYIDLRVIASRSIKWRSVPMKRVPASNLGKMPRTEWTSGVAAGHHSLVCTNFEKYVMQWWYQKNTDALLFGELVQNAYSGIVPSKSDTTFVGLCSGLEPAISMCVTCTFITIVNLDRSMSIDIFLDWRKWGWLWEKNLTGAGVVGVRVVVHQSIAHYTILPMSLCPVIHPISKLHTCRPTRRTPSTAVLLLCDWCHWRCRWCRSLDESHCNVESAISSIDLIASCAMQCANIACMCLLGIP